MKPRKYRVVTDGVNFKIQEKCFYFFWFDVFSPWGFCFYENKYPALEDCERLEKIYQRKHDWREEPLTNNKNTLNFK